jgi:hypothetical protein
VGSLARVVTVNNRVALLVNSCVVVVLPAPTSRDEEARGPITSRVNDHAADVLAVAIVLLRSASHSPLRVGYLRSEVQGAPIANGTALNSERDPSPTRPEQVTNKFRCRDSAARCGARTGGR